MLHELGYQYTGDTPLSGLTLPEIRRLLEGQRVDNKLREIAESGARGRDPKGTVIPRESDRELLAEFDDEVKQRRKN